jgi:hypothetical protein
LPGKLAEAQAADAWENGPIVFEPPGSMRDLERYEPSRGGGYVRLANKDADQEGWYPLGKVKAKAERIWFPSDAGVIDVTRQPYFARPDDGRDDTEAIQQALNDHPTERHFACRGPPHLDSLSAIKKLRGRVDMVHLPCSARLLGCVGSVLANSRCSSKNAALPTPVCVTFSIRMDKDTLPECALAPGSAIPSSG